ncbi:MAG: hypothetical protein M3Q94_18445 [Pseudomonadota bacterium]|nr:hypothetical protein [Pseudomonadota bacterium]
MNNDNDLQGGSGSEEPVPVSNPETPGHHDEDGNVDDHVPLDPNDDSPVEDELAGR